MNKVKTITIKIEGMTCASCVNRVERAIKKAEGVKDVYVNLANEQATLSIDSEKFRFNKLKEVISESGYNVIEPKLEDLQYDIFNLKSKEKFHKSKIDFLSSLIFTVPIFTLNMSMMSAELLNFLNLKHYSINYILFILTTLLILISGRKFYIRFIKNLIRFNFDMDSLISIGTASAFIYSSIITFYLDFFPTQSGHNVYFDTTAMIITLVLFGRWLETKAKFKTNQAINELIKIQPQKATVKIGNSEVEININQLKINDIVLVKPGQRIPTDGIVISGFTTVDESIITGESMPVEISVNSKVKSGSMNKTGFIEYKVTSNANDSTLGQIIRLMEQSQSTKAPIQKTADKIASVFVPIVISIAFLTFILWLIFRNDFETALVNSISVLIIACPCALGLAIPTAIIVGIGSAAKNGLLIRNGSSLEIFHKVKVIFFDKTGTLTNKKLKVDSYKASNLTIDEVLSFVVPAEKKSEHPIAEAIIEFAKNFQFKEKKLEEFESKTGLGINAIVDGQKIIIGNSNFIKEAIPKIDESISDSNDFYSKIFVAIQNKLVAIFNVSEEINEEALSVIKKFNDVNIKTFILSGDRFETTRYLAEKCKVNAFEAELLPEDKVKIIKKFQDKGLITAFIGDGINDAPSILQADVGIAMGKGADVAILSGDVILLNNNLSNIFKFSKLSKRVDLAIKQNLFCTFIYNIIGIPLAALGLLTPIFAAFAMSMSSVSVVLNSLRLKRTQ